MPSPGKYDLPKDAVQLKAFGGGDIQITIPHALAADLAEALNERAAMLRDDVRTLVCNGLRKIAKEYEPRLDALSKLAADIRAHVREG